MAYSISNKETVSFVPEVTWGTTPATPNFQYVRYVSGSWKSDTSSTKSNEITNSREVADHIRTQVKGSGSFNFELSYGNLDVLLQGLLGDTWSTNVLKVGSTKQSYTFERGFTDVSQFELYTGAIPSNLTINVGIGKVIDGSISFMSKPGAISGTTAASTTTAAPTNSVMNPIDSIQLMQEGGSGAIAGVVGFTMNLQNQVVEFPQLANIAVADLEIGEIAASGTIDIYFQDATYLTKYLAWTTTSLAFTLGGSSSLKYSFSFAKVKLSQAETPNGGMNQPLITKFNWVAFKDSTDTTVKITRTP